MIRLVGSDGEMLVWEIPDRWWQEGDTFSELWRDDKPVEVCLRPADYAKILRSDVMRLAA